MGNNLDFVGLEAKIEEIPTENTGFIQIQNLSYKMIMVTDNAYILGRSFGLTSINNPKIPFLVDKGLIQIIDTPTAKAAKDAPKPKSRKKVKREEVSKQNQVLENLGELFSTSDKNVRQTP